MRELRRDIGIAHIPEDRHRRGLLLDFSLSENSILGVQHRKRTFELRRCVSQRQSHSQTGRPNHQRLRRAPGEPGPSCARSLRWKPTEVNYWREFDLRPKLLLVSQPTRGVDIGAIEFIHRKLVALRDDGCAVLLISAELEEVTALSDRLLIIHDGKIVGDVDPKVATIEEIGLLMTGSSKH